MCMSYKFYVKPNMRVCALRDTEHLLVASQNKYDAIIDGDGNGEQPDITNGGEGNPDDIDAKPLKNFNPWLNWE